MEFASNSDKGLKRPNNEDAYFTDSSGIFIIADGMGGNAAGEVASRIAIEECNAYLKARHSELSKHPGVTLVRAVKHANDAVLSEAIRDPSLQGMGTTIVLGFVKKKTLHLAHVGDSRAYLIDPPGTIRQLTTDHSYVEELIKLGEIDTSQARSHPMRNVITRCLGSERDVKVDYKQVSLKKGDYILFCTDGLTGMVPDDAILAKVSDGKSLTEVCKDLVKQANANGGVDNITLILVKN